MELTYVQECNLVRKGELTSRYPGFDGNKWRKLHAQVRPSGLCVLDRRGSVVLWHQMSGGVTVVDEPTYFLALKKAFPRSFGSNGITRSSARNKPFSLRSILRASKGLNFPLSFWTPTTFEINLMLLDSNRSLYSLCGSFVIKHIGVVRGSISG
jgi:hypothetical protein